MGKKVKSKKNKESFEIVPKEEDLPLPPKRKSDEVVPKKVSFIVFNIFLFFVLFLRLEFICFNSFSLFKQIFKAFSY